MKTREDSRVVSASIGTEDFDSDNVGTLSYSKVGSCNSSCDVASMSVAVSVLCRRLANVHYVGEESYIRCYQLHWLRR